MSDLPPVGGWSAPAETPPPGDVAVLLAHAFHGVAIARGYFHATHRRWVIYIVCDGCHPLGDAQVTLVVDDSMVLGWRPVR